MINIRTGRTEAIWAVHQLTLKVRLAYTSIVSHLPSYHMPQKPNTSIVNKRNIFSGYSQFQSQLA